MGICFSVSVFWCHCRRCYHSSSIWVDVLFLGTQPTTENWDGFSLFCFIGFLNKFFFIFHFISFACVPFSYPVRRMIFMHYILRTSFFCFVLQKAKLFQFPTRMCFQLPFNEIVDVLDAFWPLNMMCTNENFSKKWFIRHVLHSNSI